jgi:hypothetical protein
MITAAAYSKTSWTAISMMRPTIRAGKAATVTSSTTASPVTTSATALLSVTARKWLIQGQEYRLAGQ